MSWVTSRKHKDQMCMFRHFSPFSSIQLPCPLSTSLLGSTKLTRWLTRIHPVVCLILPWSHLLRSPPSVSMAPIDIVPHHCTGCPHRCPALNPNAFALLSSAMEVLFLTAVKVMLSSTMEILLDVSQVPESAPAL